MLLSLVALVALPAGAAERLTFERPLMGTRFRVVCHSADRVAAEAAAERAFLIAEELEAIASDHLPESELSLLSSRSAGTPIAVSPALYGLVDQARRVAHATGGAFDPTLGPLTKLWRESRDRGRLPDPDELRRARAATGWEHFCMDPEAGTLTMWREGMAFDLGGMAKGYAADLMLGVFVEAGIPRALIAAGGDVRLGDPPPGREGWRVALQTFDVGEADRVLVLSNAAVSTSGDLHQSVEIDGIRYSHVLDPGTGVGLERRIAVSVIADEAKLSDPVATAACVLGEGGREAILKLAGIREVIMRASGGSMAGGGSADGE